MAWRFGASSPSPLFSILKKAEKFGVLRVDRIKRAAAFGLEAVYDRIWRLDECKLLDTLGAFGPFQRRVLMVHSSLSACGRINGGPAAVINALRDWLGAGTLAMPTHTYCYPEDDGTTPVFDARATPSLVGRITDFFRNQSGVVRSLHPTHSMAAIGPDAEWLCEGHERCDTPCGLGTPYERLVTRDCSVLMFGTTMNSYTLFHTVEDAAKVPYLYEPIPYGLFVKGPNGLITTVRMRRQDMGVGRKFTEMGEWLEDRGALVRQRFGQGELLFIPSSAFVHRLIIEEMRKDPYFLVASDARAKAAVPASSDETIN